MVQIGELFGKIKTVWSSCWISGVHIGIKDHCRLKVLSTRVTVSGLTKCILPQHGSSYRIFMEILLISTRCGWVLPGNLWMCCWLWFRHAGGRPLHRLAADSAFHSCGYWYRWIFADELSRKKWFFILNWYTTKKVDGRNSDELIWIASLSAQCCNSGNATNLLPPVGYSYYRNRPFLWPSKIPTNPWDYTFMIYNLYYTTYIRNPMFVIFVKGLQ